MRAAALCAAASFAGCAGGGSPLAPSANRVNVDFSQTLLSPRVAISHLGTISAVRQIEPGCCARAKTLFVSDAFGGSSFTGAVYAFEYPSGKLLGTLPAPPEGFSEPQGECVDDKGDVYVDNTALSTIDEYSHGGAFVETLADPGQFPVNCSFDPSTGNLAVANIFSSSGGPGNLAIYNGGVLLNTYYPPNTSSVSAIAYRARSGILWLAVGQSSGVFTYDTFSGGTFAAFTIQTGKNHLGNGMQSSALTQSMNISGTTASGQTAIFQVSAGKITGKTILDCTGNPSAPCGDVAFFIKGPRVTVTDAVRLSASMYRFPAGGHPIHVFSASFTQPIGVAVSSFVNTP